MTNWHNVSTLGILLLIVNGSVVIVYPGLLFGNEEGVALTTAFVATVVFAASAVGSKILSGGGPTRLYRTKAVQMHNWVGPLVRYIGISGVVALFGVLTHLGAIFKPTDLPYSPELYAAAHAIAAAIATATVIMSWFISAKL